MSGDFRALDWAPPSTDMGRKRSSDDEPRPAATPATQPTSSDFGPVKSKASQVRVALERSTTHFKLPGRQFSLLGACGRQVLGYRAKD